MKTEKTEWKTDTGYKGVWYREVDGIKTFYVRGRVKSTKESFFEKAERPGFQVTKASDANKVRTKVIDGDIPTNPKRREQQRAAQESALTFDALWTRMKQDPDRGHKVNDDGSIDFTVGWRGTKKADEKYRKHIAPKFGNREPKDIRVNDIESWRGDLAKKYSKATTISLIGILKSIANYGAGLQLCPGIAFPIVLKGKKLGRAPEEKKAPTEEERDKFIATCKSWSDRQEANFMLLIVYTGMRRGSARNLKWEHINLDAKTALLKDSKTGDVEIQIDDDAVALLKSHPREMVSPYVFTGRGWEPLVDKSGEPVLHKKNGRMRAMQIERDLPQLTQRQIDRVPAMIRDAAGLPADLDPCHAYRRFHANRLHNSGLNPKAGAKGGGWKSVNMYLHYLTAEDKEIKKALNATVTKSPAQA